MKNKLQLISEYSPKGDQPQAIRKLSEGILKNYQHQVLLGVTGSGKTYTMANVIEKVQKPTLVLVHNKTLAAQLCSEFREFFPNNAVEYFVSYYDYYQPEAYVPSSDTYIEKDASINDEIDKLRHSATSALSERKDVIIVASVSCIYGLGSPEYYYKLGLSLRPGMKRPRNEILKHLVDIQYSRNDINFQRGSFRVRGDILEIFPASQSELAVRVEFWGDEIERITEINSLTGEVMNDRSHIAIYPASHFVTSEDNIKRAVEDIKVELKQQLSILRDNNKLLEAQRLEQRTQYDIEMISELGFCRGIENYSRHLDGRKVGEPPWTLMDYFPDDYLLMVDESHVSLPQVKGMYFGDRSRKETLVEHGFRLPSALDNRPLKFDEFMERINQVVYTSATPRELETNLSQQVVEQIIRPTGLLDPPIDVRKIEGQIDDLYGEINKCVENNERVLVTTLTIKMAEDLTDFFKEHRVKAKYLHHDVDTIERMELIHDLRTGEYDVLVGINLLREGLDLPEVALVAILDADKEGFLRSEISLVQTVGRAARNVNGRVIMYADKITGSMERAISETERRRKIQMEFNKENNIEPKTVKKSVREVLKITQIVTDEGQHLNTRSISKMTKTKAKELTLHLEEEMKEAARKLEYEKAAELRDLIADVKKRKKIS